MNEPWDDPAAVLDLAWTLLERGAGDRTAPARFPTLATIGRDGAPQLRTVALRDADRRAGTCRVFTDRKSHKVAEIAAEPRVALHVWDPAAKVQLRLSGEARTGTGAPLSALWRALPDAARAAYAHNPPPGSPLDAPDAYTVRPAFDRFAAITLTLSAIEAVSLCERGHRRIRFTRAGGWCGTWLSP